MRARIFVAQILCTFYAAETLASTTHTLSAQERSLAVLLVLPSGAEKAPLDTSELLRVAAAALENETSLRVVSADQVGTEVDELLACPDVGRFACWLLAVRRNSKARFLFVVAELTGDDGNGLASILAVNLDRAMDLYDDLRSVEGEDRAREILDAKLLENAAARTEFLPVQDEADLLALFRALKVELDETDEGAMSPLAQIELRGVEDGLSVAVEGKVLGTTRAPTTLITDLVARKVHLSVRAPGDEHHPFETEVETEPGRAAIVEARLERISGTGSVVQTATVITGGIAVAAGVALGVYAAGASVDVTKPEPCLAGSCPEAASRSFATFCELGSADPSDCDGGVQVVPLALGLGIGGAVMGLGTLLFTEEEEIPWWSILAGVGAGATTYLATSL